MKKFLLLTISIFVILKMILISLVNYNINLSVYTPILKKTLTINFVIFIWCVFFIGMIVLYCILSATKNKKDLNAYKNQYEKIAVNNEEQSDKVKILEEKIKSLEIALEKALNK